MTVDEVRAERAVVDDASEREPRALFALLSSMYERVLGEIAHNPSADARAIARAAIGADDDAG